MNVFSFSDYKKILKIFFEKEGARSGAKGKMCLYIGCHSSYLAQVLKAPDVHFSMEQGFMAAKFMNFSSPEREFFINLVLIEKTQGKEIRTYLKKKNKSIKDDFYRTKEMVQPTLEISDELLEVFFSNWVYSAVFAMATVGKGVSVKEVQDKLRVKESVVLSVIDFLVENHFLAVKNGRLRSGSVRIHLDKKHLLSKHHMNWRSKVMVDLQCRPDEGLHYSGLLTMSREDFDRLETKWRKEIEKSVRIVNESDPEDVFVLGIDLYPM